MTLLQCFLGMEVLRNLLYRKMLIKICFDKMLSLNSKMPESIFLFK